MSENNAASNADEVSSAEAKPDTPRSAPQPRAPSNHIYVGNKKPVMSYAMSTLLQLGQSEEVVLKARGMAISNTVDVAEIVSKRLGNNAFVVKNIKIDTEMVGQGDDQRNVSTIEIVLGKK
jgi:DNA-binding protein